MTASVRCAGITSASIPMHRKSISAMRWSQVRRLRLRPRQVAT